VLRVCASKDGVDTLVVPAVVTEDGAEPSELVSDRAAALEADVFRFLPRDAHRAAPLPFIAAGAPPELPQAGPPSLTVVGIDGVSRPNEP
jgi:hypothetical protein